MKPFPHYHQLDAMDCGPTCLRMVAKYYGRDYEVARLRDWCEIGKDGVNLLGIAQAAERIGFRTLAVRVTLEKLLNAAPLPCIVHWGQNHFVVVAPQPPNGEFFSLPKRWLAKIWGGKKPPLPPRWGNLEYGNNNNITNETDNRLLLRDGTPRGRGGFVFQSPTPPLDLLSIVLKSLKANGPVPS